MQTLKRNADQRVFVIWLERIEDIWHFPVGKHQHSNYFRRKVDAEFKIMIFFTEEMFSVSGDGSLNSFGFLSRPDYVAIFICQVEENLVQINIRGNFTKYYIFLKLVF